MSPRMSPLDVMRQEVRLIILRALGEQQNRRMTASALTLYMNEMFLLGWDRAEVDQELDYLERMGAIQIIPAGTTRVAKLLRHGARHLSHDIIIPGIMQSTDPIDLPEAKGG